VSPDPKLFTLKRAAWAYGCAKKGSKEERELLQVLREKALERFVPDELPRPSIPEQLPPMLTPEQYDAFRRRIRSIQGP
jgi:hypothetical protein